MMSKRILLTESFSIKFKEEKGLLKESLLEGSGDYIKFAALPLDIETGNSRVYSTREVAPAISESNELLKSGQIVLRCTSNGHPEEEFPEPSVSSHKIVESWIENGHVWCKAKILQTTEGNNLRGLISEGDPIGISVRGTGTLNGKYVTDYQFYGADFVAIPSTGLMVIPESAELSDGKPFVVKENLNSDNKVKTAKDKNSMKSINLKELQSLITESKKEIENSKTKVDRSLILLQTESELRSLSSLILEGSKNPISDIYTLISEWMAIKESLEEKDLKENEEEPLEENEEHSKEELQKENKEIEELKESLDDSVNMENILKSNFVRLYESKEFIKKAYDNLRNEKNKISRALIKSELKNKSIKQIQESQQRAYNKNLLTERKINEKLAQDNINLVNSSDNSTLNEELVKLATAYKLTAVEAIKEKLELTHGSGKK